MRNYRKKISLMLLFFCLLGIKIFSLEQKNYQFKYSNTSINQIIYDFSVLLDKSIIPDFTVPNEKTSFFFISDDINKAFNVFLKKNFLYIERKDTSYVITKIRLLFDDYENIQLDAHRVNLYDLIEKISLYSTIPSILYSVKEELVSIHISNTTLEKFITILIQKKLVTKNKQIILVNN